MDYFSWIYYGGVYENTLYVGKRAKLTDGSLSIRMCSRFETNALSQYKVSVTLRVSYQLLSWFSSPSSDLPMVLGKPIC
jgi:hypothetical protein